MFVICRNCDTEIIARHGSAEAISEIAVGLLRPDKSGLAMTGRRAQDDTRLNIKEQKLSAVL